MMDTGVSPRLVFPRFGGILNSMPELRSKTSTHGRMMAGARALWRATGMNDDDFGKPIVAIANSFTQFVPGHVHLRNIGALVADAVSEARGVRPPVKTNLDRVGL